MCYDNDYDILSRDIKAANMLIDDDGTVLLGDLGVAASLVVDDQDSTKAVTPKRRIDFDLPSKDAAVRPMVPNSRPKIGKRKSFVGTPCWMAPEIISSKQYDSSADIWSFGITALELTQGRPPRSRESPHAVLLQTVQGVPPTLDRAGGEHKYSKAFKEIVEACLVKDPSKRPSAEELLQSAFFKAAKKKSYLVGAILSGLPPLTQRQERTALPPSAITHGTMDSWDFSLTVSPTGSLSLRQARLLRASLANRGLDSEDVFDFEGDQEDVGVSPGVSEDEEQAKDREDAQVHEHGHEPLSTPEIASSVSSRSSTAPSPTAQSTTSSEEEEPKMTRTGITHSSPPQPVPVPKGTSSHSSAQPNSNPALPASPEKLSSTGTKPSTSAPSLWRKFAGGPAEGAVKDGTSAKNMKGFLARKASEANDILGKSKTKSTGRSLG